MTPPLQRVEAWFNARGWQPFDFQRECWDAHRRGQSGLVHAPTGTGKTLAVWLGPVLEALEAADHSRAHNAAPDTPDDADRPADTPEPLRVLWITPLRALATDTRSALTEPVHDLGLNWSVELRTGDVSSAAKQRQRKRLPTCLITTPESLSILLSYPDARATMRTLRAIVVDEWHELLGTKRGVQTELALARLRRWRPDVRTWGLSATLGNTDEAARVLLGPERAPSARLIRGVAPKEVRVETLMPDEIERFPWAGHLGTKLVDRVAETIERANTTLLFTNTRSQAEIWFRRLNEHRPDWLGSIALHHGSLDREIRNEVERRVRTGEGGDGAPALRCVVCTSSLDLGVDFSPVDQVIQVGSPKGVARLLQRAGRSGHQPGAISRIVGVPTHAFEMVEFAAAREALARGVMEARRPIEGALDLLVQHLVTIAAGGGFVEDELLGEVRDTHAFRKLTDAQWRWAMDFVRRGGPALTAYEHFARITSQNGRWGVASPKIGRLHRMAIGTITSDPAVVVRYASGRTLGSIEEGFIARLRPGDRFVFAGRVLELVKLHEMSAIVKRATKRSNAVPRWNGGRMPLSSQLAGAVRTKLDEARRGRYPGPEMQSAAPLLELQKSMSVLPAPDELLIERIKSRLGWHTFVFPMAGRLAHEGLAPLVAHRLARTRPITVTAGMTDYGIELLARDPVPLEEDLWRALLSPDDLLEDLLEAINAGELARRHFREIARIAGLTHPGYPGRVQPMRHLQASSDMYYEVFREFDPDNLLLEQSQREVMEGQLEIQRLRDTLETCARMTLVMAEPGGLTPMAFPLFAERLRATQVSTESWDQRVRAMAVELERAMAERA